jgi:hypothetical protein
VSPTELVEAATEEELPQLAGQLTEALARCWLRLHAARAERFLTVGEAAELLRVPERRVRSWARRAPWAVRPGGRCLRVDEKKLLAWAGCSPSSRTAQPNTLGATTSSVSRALRTPQMA